MGVLYKFFSFIGFLLLLVMIAGASYDFVTHEKNLDLTKLDKTSKGFVKRGYVLDFHYDCKSGGFKGIQVFRAMVSYKEMSAEQKSRLHFQKACEGMMDNKTAAAPKTESTTETKTTETKPAETTEEKKPEEKKDEPGT